MGNRRLKRYFHSSMIELGLLGLLILVLVVSIHFCVAALPDRRSCRNSEVRLLFPQGMRKDAPIYSQVQRFRLDGRYQIGRDAGHLDILFANASAQLLIADTRVL